MNGPIAPSTARPKYAAPVTSLAAPLDESLPQLAMAFDAPAIGRLLAAELPAHGTLTLLGCRIDRIKYRPRRNCSISYVLTLRDHASGEQFEQHVGARAFGGGESANRYQRARQRPSMASRAGPSLTHLERLDLHAAWAPNDGKLDALPVLYDGCALRRRWLPEVADAATGAPTSVLAYRSELVQLVPEDRACARFELQLQGGQALICFAKLDAHSRGAVTHALMQAVQTAAEHSGGRLRTARPLLWQPQAGLHWQAGLRGEPLAQFDPHIGAQHGAAVGMALAALHGCRVPAEPLSADELRARLHDASGALALVQPLWAQRLRALTDRLLDTIARLDESARVTLHNDLHPNNILFDDGRPSFIDLDGVRIGPAALDLGAWLADLRYRALVYGFDDSQAIASGHALLRGYASSAELPSAAALACAAALHLLRTRAYRCISNLKEGRLASVPAVLGLAEAISAACSVDIDRRDAATPWAPVPISVAAVHDAASAPC